MFENLRDIRKIWKKGGLENWLLFRQSVNDPEMHRKIYELNKVIEDSEIEYKRLTGRDLNLKKHRLLDWFV